MSIIYTAIVRSFKKVLCEYTESNGNFQQVSMLILTKINANTESMIDYQE